MDPTPGWWDEAVGGLVQGGLISLLPAWLALRARRWSWLLIALWLVLAVTVLYYGLRGWLTVPPYLLKPVPAWALVGTFFAGVLVSLVAVEVVRRLGAARQTPQPAQPQLVGPPPSPTHAEMWNSLSTDERQVLEVMWENTDRVFINAAYQAFVRERGAAAWNAVEASLEKRKLVVDIFHISHDRLALTPKGRDLMLWRHEQVQHGPEPAA